MDISDLTKGIEKLEKWKGIPAIDVSTLKRFHQRPFYHNPPLVSTMAVASLELVAVTILIIAICFQAYRHQKQQLRSQDPSYRYNELLKDHESMDKQG